MTGREARRPGAWLFGLALALTGPSGVAAQQAEPLTKTELVRFLSGGVYTTDELASLVRRSCLSFDPSERDREDLRSLGAGEPVMAAIEWCGRPLDVSIEPAGLTLRAGQTGSVTLGASRDGQPVGGVGLTLGAGEGAAVSGVTGESGLVRLPVSASGRVRSYRLPVRATGGAVSGDPAVAVRVVAGPPRAASLSPPSVVLDAGADSDATVRAALRDAYGNPVPGVAVTLTDPRTGFGVSTGRTETGGEAELRIASGAVVENGLLELRSEGRVLGELVVRVGARSEESDAAAAATPDPAEPEPAADEGDQPVAPESGRPEDAREGARRETEPTPGEVVDAGRDSVPEGADALGEARTLGDRGEIDRAVALYRTAIARAPRGIALRLELASLLDRANRFAEARTTYEEVVAIAPGNVEASRGLARLRRESVRVDARVSGGATTEGSLALRGASVSVRPLRFLRVWGRYDRSFGLGGVPLIRGPDEIEGYFGGVALSWGADRLFTTSVEVGRRIDDVAPGSTAASLDENTVRVEQRALVPAGRGYAAVSAGGYLGRWFDRDDWLAWARVRVPLGDRLSIGPAVFTGETMGTDAGERGRAPERETRVELPIRVESPGVWFVEPGGAVGWVAPLDDGPTRRLYEVRLHAEVTVTEGVAVLVFGRHQRAPDTEPFTLGTIGLRLRFD